MPSRYQQADLILLNGAGYAKWVRKVSLLRSKTVDTSRGFKDQFITVKETMTHSHGAEGGHAHERLAYTTWMDYRWQPSRLKRSFAKGFSKTKRIGGIHRPVLGGTRLYSALST